MDGVSKTAIGVALRRAAHLLLDADPKLLVDRFAGPLAGFSTDEAILTAFSKLPLANVPWMKTPFVLRDRYAEDRLARAVAEGTRQCVILGAGLNSFAHRRPAAMAGLQVFEVDEPTTQAWKRQRVTDLGLPDVTGLHYVPVDFETETLRKGLLQTSFDGTQRAFFSWIGVTQYLTRDAVTATLADVSALSATGSEVVIQFIASPESLSEEDARLVQTLADSAAAGGEPWLSLFRPDELEAQLRRAGFDDVSHFAADEAQATYLAGRADGLRLPGYFRMISGTRSS